MPRLRQPGRSALAVLVFCVIGLLPGHALAGYAAMVVDADSGRILHADNADTRNYPASLTKMMTIYMAFEAIDRGRVSFDTPVRMSARAVAQPPTKLGLKVGSRIALRDAILALITKSANDVSVAVAETLGGSETQFARMMTERARQLGMSRTTFRNASGLPDRGQLSTARDMATLGLALLRHFPHHYRYFATQTFRYAGRSYRNHNRLLGNYAGLDGIKTGYIRASGYNLVASAHRGGRRLIGVVFGGKSSAQRNRKMAQLLDEGFQTLASSGRYATPPNVVGGQLGTAGAGVAGRTWGVQVGAFRARAAAEKTAQQAAHHLRVLMPGSGPHVQRSRRGNGAVYYLARVLYGRKGEAHEACELLEAHRFRCLVLRMKAAPGPGDTAAINVPPRIEPPAAKPIRSLASATPIRSLAGVTPTGGAAPSWGVQVGAFPARDVAERTATEAVLTVPETLGTGDVDRGERHRDLEVDGLLALVVDERAFVPGR